MKDPQSSSVQTVHDPEAAAILTSLDEMRFLAPFLARDRTVAAVALETGEKANTVFVRVRRFLRLGLLRVVSERPRAGRAVKVYRSSADAYFVPKALAGSVEGSGERWMDYWDRLFARALSDAFSEDPLGVRIYRDEHGVFSTSVARDPHENVTMLEPQAPALFSMFHDDVRLDFEDAKRFQRELHELVQRYVNAGGAQRYALRLNLVPVSSDAPLIP